MNDIISKVTNGNLAPKIELGERNSIFFQQAASAVAGRRSRGASIRSRRLPGPTHGRCVRAQRRHELAVRYYHLFISPSLSSLPSLLANCSGGVVCGTTQTYVALGTSARSTGEGSH